MADWIGMTNDSTHVNVDEDENIQTIFSGIWTGHIFKVCILQRRVFIIKRVIGKYVLGCCYSGNNSVVWTHDSML